MLTLRSRFGCPKYTGHHVVVLLWSNFYCALLHIQVLVVYKAASLVTYGISAREKNQFRANVNLFFNCMKFKMDTWYLWLVSFPQEMNILEILEYFVYLFVFNAFLLLTDIFCWYLDLYVMSTGHCVCTGSALDSLCGRGRGSGLSPYCQGELTPLGLWNAASLDVLLTTCSFLNWQLYSHISPMLM